MKTGDANIRRGIYIILFLVFGAGCLSGQDFTSDTVLIDSFVTNDSEFEPFVQEPDPDEFLSFENAEVSDCSSTCNGCTSAKSNSQLWWVLAALAATVMAGLFVRFKSTRNLRGVTLIASMVLFGFYVGGCPCPIMSLQQVFFFLFGQEPNWTGMLWFLGLIPVTYLFGRVWCGWICHLGALQEFLYLPGKIKILQSNRAQIVMRWVRILLLVALIIQILITQTNLFKEIDPFKVAFNLRSASLTGWILLGLILTVSLFMFRPFCKTVCPIGLILGWVAKVPGATILAPSETCKGCLVCNKSCSINAITCDHKVSQLDNQECIACGNCLGDCKSGSMIFVNNTKRYASKTECKGK